MERVHNKRDANEGGVNPSKPAQGRDDLYRYVEHTVPPEVLKAMAGVDLRAVDRRGSEEESLGDSPTEPSSSRQRWQLVPAFVVLLVASVGAWAWWVGAIHGRQGAPASAQVEATPMKTVSTDREATDRETTDRETTDRETTDRETTQSMSMEMMSMAARSMAARSIAATVSTQTTAMGTATSSFPNPASAPPRFNSPAPARSAEQTSVSSPVARSIHPNRGVTSKPLTSSATQAAPLSSAQSSPAESASFSATDFEADRPVF